jgi:hypothetical protein
VPESDLVKEAARGRATSAGLQDCRIAGLQKVLQKVLQKGRKPNIGFHHPSFLPQSFLRSCNARSTSGVQIAQDNLQYLTRKAGLALGDRDVWSWTPIGVGQFAIRSSCGG